VIKSEKAGLGKTLFKDRLVQQLSECHPTADDEEFPLSITIPLDQEEIRFNEISRKFMNFTLQDIVYPRILHIDVACGVLIIYFYDFSPWADMGQFCLICHVRWNTAYYRIILFFIYCQVKFVFINFKY
jgi:hypothetical protein